MFRIDLRVGKLNTRKLSPGSYETIPDILKAMALTSHAGKMNFKFNPHTKRVKIKTTDGANVILEKSLCSILGFQPQVIGNITESSFTADPHTEFPIFYVYSEIVQPVVVGHPFYELLEFLEMTETLSMYSMIDHTMFLSHFNHFRPSKLKSVLIQET
ncbi:uncharacterized protein CDAR_89061 [Caerostris darwini]|uniref:Uncharacterized protein n=1 Tax=Caerostris darwini TaxID=1538125 RepID=A0AAV4RE83_9ARAC|nr:uncharacterized protein CDAR_89061 [Caerostris darwini]